MDYRSSLIFGGPEQVLRSMHLPPLRKRKEKSNGACFSCIAPSSEELRTFEVVLIHSSNDLYHACAWQVYVPITPHWKVL